MSGLASLEPDRSLSSVSGCVKRVSDSSFVAATWARIFDASRGLVVSYTVMDVLIVEPDELIGTVLADALDQDGLTATLVPDEQKAFDLPPHDAPRVVITGMNRGNNRGHGGAAHRAGAAKEMAWHRRDLHGGLVAGPLASVRARCPRAIPRQARPISEDDPHRARTTGGGGHAPSGGIEAMAFPDRADRRGTSGAAATCQHKPGQSEAELRRNVT